MPEVQTKETQSSSLRRALELDTARTVFPTGSPTIDGLLGGGLRTGEMVELFGASNTGKTQLGMQASVSVASLGERCAYIDTEGQFRPERISSMCVARGIEPEKALKSIFLVRAESTRRQSLAIETIRKDAGLNGCRLVVVDTLTKNFSLELGGGRMVGRRQTMLGAYLNRLARDAYLHDRAVLLLNRVASFGAGESSTEIDIGGQTVRHFVKKALRMRRRGAKILVSVEDSQPAAEAETTITAIGLE